MLPDIAIQAERLRKTYGDVVAVDDVSLQVPRGSVLGVLGPNGAGKTTTVRMLATLTRPTSGCASVFGRDIVSQATAVRSLISLTGQYASVDEDLTARENLELFARLLRFSGRAARHRAAELLEQFDLTAAADRPVSGFSGGMRRRVDLASSMIRQPALLFLDEPTTGLDPTTRVAVWAAVRDLVSKGTTVLLTTQYLEEADQLSDSLIVIDKGRVVASGHADVLKDRFGSRSLEISIDDTTRLSEAAERIGAVLDTTVSATAEGGKLVAPLSDPALSARVIVELERDGISIAEVAVRRPSLDDVFFSITSSDLDGSSDPLDNTAATADKDSGNGNHDDKEVAA